MAVVSASVRDDGRPRRALRAVAGFALAFVLRQPAHAIMYGTVTTAYPSVVELGYAEPFRPYCTGTVIGPRTVLTAGHCVGGEDPGALAMRVDGRVVRARDLCTHPRFDWPLYDVALLHLAADAGVEPMPLARRRFAAGPATVVGYGITESEDHDGEKRVGVVRIDRCPRHDPDLRTSSCQYVQLGEANACSGDSGGPVCTADGLVGITSGYDYACDEGLSFNTDLGRGRIRAWIKHHLDD
jgi:hypothetical protein